MMKFASVLVLAFACVALAEQQPWLQSADLNEVNDLLELAKEAESAFMAVGATTGVPTELPPYAPVTCVSTTSNTLTVRWPFDAPFEDTYHPNPTKFNVSVYAESTTRTGKVSLSGLQWYILENTAAAWSEDVITVTLTDANLMPTGTLAHATTYHVRLQAMNSVGWNELNMAVPCTTAPMVPSAPVDLKDASQTSTTSVTVTWSPPADNGGAAVIAYHLTGFAATATVIPVGADSTGPFTYEITGLQESTPYNIKVAAQNDAGVGAESTAVTVTTFAPAPAIVSFTASDPDNADNVFSVGDVITVVFDRAVKASAASIDDAAVNSILSFTPTLGATVSGAWSANFMTLSLTVTEVKTSISSPVVGSMTVACGTDVIASVGTSSSCSSSGIVLEGNFGTNGLEEVWTINSGSEVFEDADFFINPSLHIAAPTADRIIRVEFAVVAPTGANFVRVEESSTPNLGSSFILDCAAMSAHMDALVSHKLVLADNYNGAASVSITSYACSCDGDACTASTTASGKQIQFSSILPVNDAPALAITDPVNKDTLAATDAIEVTSLVATALPIVVSDVDQAAVSGTGVFTATLNPGAYGQIGFTGTQAEKDAVSILPSSAPARAAVVTVEGTYAAVNALLATTTITYDILPGMVVADSANPASLSVMVSDNGDGSPTQEALMATSTHQVEVKCAGGAAPVFTKAVIKDSIVGMTLYIDPATAVQYSTDVLVCANLFTDASVFGKDAVCKFLSGTMIDVTFGTADTTVTAGTAIEVKANALARCSGGNFNVITTLTVMAPENEPTPTASINGQSTLSKCDVTGVTEVVYTSSVSFVGVNGRSGTYAWACTAPANCDILTGATVDEPMVKIPTAKLTGTDYTITLTVTNYLGTKNTKFGAAPATRKIAVSGELLPSVIVADTFSLDSENEAFIIAEASTPGCDLTNLPVSAQALTYLWADASTEATAEDLARADAGAFTALPTITGQDLTTPTLGFAVNTLTPGASHLVKITATITSSGKSTSALTVLNVAPIPLTAGIKGGDRTIGVDKTLVLDGGDTLGTVPTGSSIIYEWSCTDEQNNACRNPTTLAFLPVGTQTVHSVLAGSLATGVYKFTLTTTLGSQVSTDYVMVTIAAAGTPTALITLDVLGTIRTNERIVANVAILEDASPETLEDRYTFAWSYTQNGMTTTLASTSSVVTFNSLAGKIFTAGAEVDFSVTATRIADSVSAGTSTSRTVNIPPSSGSFSFLPAAGIASLGSTLLELTASGWIDPDSSSVLVYQFFYQVGDEIITFERTPANTLDTNAVVPSGRADNKNVFGVTVFDVFGDSTTSATQEITITAFDVAAVTAAATEVSNDCKNTRDASTAAGVKAVGKANAANCAANEQTCGDTMNGLLECTEVLAKLQAPEDAAATVSAAASAPSSKVSMDAVSAGIRALESISDASTDLTPEWSSSNALALANLFSLLGVVQASNDAAANRRLLQTALPVFNTTVQWHATFKNTIANSANLRASVGDLTEERQDNLNYASMRIQPTGTDVAMVSATNLTSTQATGYFKAGTVSGVTAPIDVTVAVNTPCVLCNYDNMDRTFITDAVSVYASDNTGSVSYDSLNRDAAMVEISYFDNSCNVTDCLPQCVYWNSASESWTDVDTVVPTVRDGTVKCVLDKSGIYSLEAVAAVPKPTLTKITSSAGCVQDGTGLLYCAVSDEVVSVMITMYGTNFGFSAATSNACASPPTHVSGSEDTMLVCKLAPGMASSSIEAAVTTFGGVSNTTSIGYAFAPELEKITTKDGCYATENSLRNCPWKEDDIVRLTFLGSKFAAKYAKVDGLCRDEIEHIGGFPTSTQRLECRLLAGEAGSTREFTLKTIGGSTETLTVSYAADTCTDGVLNGDEVEIDCGGTCLPCSTNPILTRITSSGCFDQENTVRFCPVDGSKVTITIEGEDFGNAGARAPQLCAAMPVHVTGQEGTKMTCTLKDGVPSSAVSVAVTTRGGTTATKEITYAIRPRVTSVSATGGCSALAAPALGLADCTPSGVGVSLTILGTNFGGSSAPVSSPACATDLFHCDANPTTCLTCTLKARGDDDTETFSVYAIGGKALETFTVNYQIVPTCQDGERNGQETGVDCGGPQCSPCVSKPVLSAVSATGGCVTRQFQSDTGLQSELRWCPIYGDDTVTVTFTGAEFADLDGVVRAVPVPNPCKDGKIDTATNNLLICKLAAGDAATGFNVRIAKSANGGGTSERSVFIDYAVAPTLNRVTVENTALGCSPSDDGGLTGCPSVGGVTVTFVGAGFGTSGFSVTGGACATDPFALNRTHLVCTLAPRVPDSSIAFSRRLVQVRAVGGLTRTVPIRYLAPPSCNDGRLNGNERAVDCGGVDCPACVTPPTLTSLRSGGSCVAGASGLSFCPVNSESDYPTVITMFGSGFTQSNFSVSGVCADAPVLNADGTLRCTLVNGFPAESQEIFVHIPGGSSNKLTITRAVAPELASITASGGCTVSNGQLIDCPRVATGVELTFTGSFFGINRADVPSVCVTGTTRHGDVAGENVKTVLRCDLKSIAENANVDTIPVRVQSIGGLSNTLFLSYSATQSSTGFYTQIPFVNYTPEFTGFTRTLIVAGLLTAAAAVTNSVLSRKRSSDRASVVV